MADIWNETWMSLLLVFAGMLLLRVAGRKSISQMTVPTTIIMISIGTLIVQPIANKSVWMAILSAAIFILVLVAVELLQVRWNGLERLIRGPSVIVIQDGKLVTAHLKKIRLTVDQLEMKLRQAGISRISDVKTATVEPNGRLGYELLEDARPVTLKQLKELLAAGYAGAKTRQTSGEEPTLFEELQIGPDHVGNGKLQ